MKHEKAVRKLMPRKRPPKGFDKCGFIVNSKNKIIEVTVPTEIFQEQFSNFNEQNIFFEIFEYIEEINEE